MNHIYTPDIKLASILAALGIPTRSIDPITCIIEEVNGQRNEKYTFWFDGDGESGAKAKELIKAYYALGKNWDETILDKEHPLYWMKGALDNRETYLHWIRSKVVPMRIIQHGEKTVLLSDRASTATQAKIRKLIN
jgi:hypothetical protein